MFTRHHRIPVKVALVALVAGVLFLCLGGMTACSDQVLGETPETVSVGHTPKETEDSLHLGGETSGSIGLPSVGDPYADAPHVLYAHFLDTGKSDAILLRLDDTVILMDTGETDDYPAIDAALKTYGITAIDYLIITHFDNDHIGTAATVLKNYPVGEVYMPDYVRDSRLYRTMVDVLDNILTDTAVHRVTEDVTIELDYGSVRINPTHLYENGLTLGSDGEGTVQENNFSLVTVVEFGEVKLLLTGDAEEDRMAEFNALGETADYDLIKTPHHGSYYKSFGATLDAAKPRYCVVCTDSTDFVEASLVTKMRSVAAAAYYTCNGAVTFTTDGQSMVLTQD